MDAPGVVGCIPAQATPFTHGLERIAIDNLAPNVKGLSRVLSLSHNFLFIHIPKTGGNSVQIILENYSEDKIVAYPHQDGVERFEVHGTYTKWKHDCLADYRRVIPSDIYARLFRFSVVRNPWSRAVSFYFSPHHWVKRRQTPHWSRDLFLTTLDGLKSNVAYLKTSDGLKDLDRIIRYERLDQELPEALRCIGIDPAKHQLPHVNRSHVGDYRGYFQDDPELVAVVRDRYREDIEHFGYSFES